MRAALLAAALLAAALPGVAAPVAVPGAQSFEMTAGATGLRYRIYLALPEKPAPEAGFPVLYFLDGEAVFGTAAEAMRLQTRGPKGFEGAAVVAIGHGGAGPFDPEARYRDFTTPADPAHLPRRSDGAPLPGNGGAEAFLDFIAGELMPEIARRLPADPARATLIGHSLGGFFALHAFLGRPGLFQNVVAGSPSVWWNRSELLAQGRAFATAPPAPRPGSGSDSGPDAVSGPGPGPDSASGPGSRNDTDNVTDTDFSGHRLFIGVGSEELPEMRAGARAMAETLAPLRARGLALAFREFAEEEHTSVIPALVSRAFAIALAPEAPEGDAPPPAPEPLDGR